MTSYVDRATFVWEECVRIVARRKYVWLFALVAPIVASQFVSLSLNVTESLPERFFVIVKGASVARGDYVAFRWHGGGPYREGTTFVKIVAGVAGDSVTEENRAFYVNGEPVGVAKTHSRTGMPLEPGPTGIIQEGHLYVRATHKDSLDSRYSLTGWIRRSEVIGKAYAIF